MAKSFHATTALQYLSAPESFKLGAVCAVYGEDSYLKQEVLRQLRRQVLGGAGDEFALTTLTGDVAQWKDAVDALATVSLFGSGARMVILQDADDFVSEYRPKLEAWVDHPSAGSVLVLDVSTWPANTRLAKAVAARGLAVDCRVPEKGADRTAFIGQAKKWLTARAREVHGAPLESTAADLLFDLLPLSLGIIDQEVAKLALYVSSGGKIDAKLVSEQVGDWRTRQTWDMIDAMVDGRASEAMRQLHLLILSGEEPIALFGQISYTLRNFAAASTLIAQAEAGGGRLPIAAALKQAGVKWQWDKMERQLKQIGRHRAGRLNDWLLETDLALKGHNSSGPRARLELERLIVKLSAANAPV
jgi:DNA polymerase-3 subunit delta